MTNQSSIASGRQGSRGACRCAARPGRRPRRGAARLACALSLLLGSGLAAAIPAPVVAPVDGRGPAGIDRPAVEGGDLRVLQGRAISLDEAIEMAQRRYNARVVRAEVVERDGRRVYVLRLLSDGGRVFNVRVDAATGGMQ